jgi:hypothetical protein
MRGKQNMKNKLAAIKEAAKQTENATYWILAAVKVGEITKAEAGLLIYQIERGI